MHVDVSDISSTLQLHAHRIYHRISKARQKFYNLHRCHNGSRIQFKVAYIEIEGLYFNICGERVSGNMLRSKKSGVSERTKSSNYAGSEARSNVDITSR